MTNPTRSPTWKRLEARWAAGFEQLLPEEQQAIALYWLEAETMNGTLNQFFWNSSGDLALIAREGLHRLEMPITLQTLDTALAYFGLDYPVDREQRMAALEILERDYGHDLFIPESRVIQDLPEDFIAAAVERLQRLYADLAFEDASNG